MSLDPFLVGAGPAVVWQEDRIPPRQARAVSGGREFRNGMPAPAGYVWRAKDRRREEQAARILAGIQAEAAAREARRKAIREGGGEA